MPGNILIVTRNFYPNIGGVESYITEFIKCYTKRSSSRVFIITPIKADLPEPLASNSKIVLICPRLRISFINIDRERRSLLTLSQALLAHAFILLQAGRLLLNVKWDIPNIYGVGGPFAIFPSLILAKVFKTKCFGHIHADFQFIQRRCLARKFYKAMFNKLDRVFVNSVDAKIDLLKIGVIEQRIKIIHNWVDTQTFRLKDRRACRESLGLPLNKKILLFVGRLSKEKGILQVLECIDILRDCEEYLFLVIGDGPLMPEVRRRLEGNKNALYLGAKRGVELADYYNAADALLWGSIDTHYVSIIIMEALHCGLPVIAPRITTQDGKIGIKEYYVTKETLPLEVGKVSDGDVKSLIKAVDAIFNTEFNREKIKRYALERYNERNVEPVFSELH